MNRVMNRATSRALPPLGALFRYAACFAPSAAVLVFVQAGSAAIFLPALLIIFVLADAAFGLAPRTTAAAPSLLLCRVLPWLYIPLQLGLIGWGAAVTRGMATGQLVLVAVDIGVTSGIFGMLAAHEMMHSRSAAERGLGLAMLAAVGYGHFRIAHIHIHHRLAATLADSATARRGEGVYRFILRSIAGQWRDACAYEQRRAAKKPHPWLANRIYRDALGSLALAVLLATALGGRALVFAAIHGAVAVFVLELFNYIAHYGLLRRVLPDGRVEPLGPRHSWNARQRFTNWTLFNSGRHSDHHRRPVERYPRLQNCVDELLLPAGYPLTFCLALVPPLWRKIMDPRLAEV